MPGGNGMGPAGQGGGMNARNSQRRGQMNGPLAAGPNGECVCPGCGYSESHTRGMPCTQKNCPKCGAALTRRP